MLLRVKMTMSAGPWVGTFALLLFAVFYMTLKLLAIFVPADSIEKAPDFPMETYKYNRHLLDHSLKLPHSAKSASRPPG